MDRRQTAGWIRVTSLLVLSLFLLLGLTLTYALLNPDSLKPLAVYLTKVYTGRQLTIDGSVELEVSMQPRITARDIRFANAQWASQPDMLSATTLAVQLDLNALTERRLRILELNASNAVLHLEDPVEGRGNWNLRDRDPEDSRADWSFVIEVMQIEHSEIHLLFGELAPIDIEITSLSESSDPDGHLHLDGSGQLNDAPWRLDGRMGPFEALVAGGRVELDLALTIEDVDVTARGAIGELRTLSELDLAIGATGPDADILGEIFGMPEAFAGDVALSAQLSPVPSGHAFEVSGHISSFEVATRGSVEDLNALDGWDTDIAISGPEAAVFSKALQIDGLPEGPFTINGKLHRHGGDLDLTDVLITTEDATLTLHADFTNFPERDGALGNLRLSGADISKFSTLLQLPDIPTVPFELTLALGATENTFTVELKAGTHIAKASGTLGNYPSFQGTRLATTFEGTDITEILSLAGVGRSLAGAYQGSTLFEIDAEGLSATDIRIQTGEFTLSADGRMPALNKPQTFSVTGSLSTANLADAAEQLNITSENLPAEPLAIEAELQSDTKGYRLVHSTIRFKDMVGNVRGSLGTLQGIEELDLQIGLQGPDIETLFREALPSKDTLIPFSARTRIRGQAQAIAIDGFELESGGGRIAGDGLVSLRDEFVGSALSIRGSGQQLSGFIPALRYYVPSNETWDAAFDVSIPSVNQLVLKRSSLHIGTVSVSASGILDLDDQGRTELVFDASGDSMNEIGQFGDVPWPDLPFSISTRLDGSADAIAVTRWQAELGQSDLTATGSINLKGKPAIVLQGTSGTMIIDDLQKAIFGEPEDIEPADDSSRVIPDTPVSISDLAAFDADIDIQVGLFQGVNARLEDIHLLFKVKDGVLELDRAVYRDHIGSFEADAVLSPEGDKVRVVLNVKGDHAELGMFTTSNQAPETVPRYSLDVRITGLGATVAEIASGLNGQVLISSDGGRIDNALLHSFAGDFLSNVLDVLNPFVKAERFTNMDCMVINSTIRDGIINLEPGFVMRTNRVNMFVLGKVNLASERLDLSLATQARKGIGISAASITNPYFKIGGTLAAPALQLDPGSAALAASIATATAGLSIVIRGFWDRLQGETNPCPAFLDYQPE